ncbi:MAG TPA: hypothetical protein VJB94_03230 [Candidatus Nanoarchaeia archaeon]|nr:hypothetical protein [Candidatus Nanoarchaeia archaeon]
MSMPNISGRESMTERLVRLKSQESRPAAKPFVGLNLKIVDEKPKEAKPMFDENVHKAEVLARKIDDLGMKIKSGENYLNYYSEIKMLEDQFLDAMSKIQNISDTAYKRLLIKKQLIEKKRMK